jgi:thioester reductase-like protein
MNQPMKVLLTGGTGFLGEYLLVDLLERGHTVWALYRNESRKLDTIRFLSSLGLPRSADSLKWFKGEILEADEQWETWCREYEGLEEVDTLLHSAASTRLHMDEYGEPLKTNLGSAKVLCKLVERHPMKVHLISTAYVCGLVQGEIMREVNHPRGDFVNVYEESKWEAEQLWMGNATILRPSIIVGHSETGRCTSFSGWYILFQAVHLLDRLMTDAQDSRRADLQINVPADPRGTTNIIPVDYVAKAAVRIIENPANHNKIFHLTHQEAPSHEYTLDYVCRRFNFGGLHLVGAGAPFTQPRNMIERMVWRQMQTILFHFANNPVFDRTNIDAALPDLKPPVVTEEFVTKLIDYAIEHDWGHAGK